MRLWRLSSWGLVAAVCAVPAVVFGALQASQPKVSFTCSGPGGLSIEGTGNELKLTDRPDAVVVTVPMANISTGMGIRDTHMHGKYLESAKYPTAELVVPRGGLNFPAEGATVDASAPGTMTIHGKSKPVTFHYKATRHGKSYDVRGDVHIDMRDFGIETPSYLGVTVKPPVDVKVSFQILET